jgi:hypothetical protein
VKLVTRSSYSHHYRRVVPVLLDVLSFQCNNERHRPVMDALADEMRRFAPSVFASQPIEGSGSNPPSGTLEPKSLCNISDFCLIPQRFVKKLVGPACPP